MTFSELSAVSLDDQEGATRSDASQDRRWIAAASLAVAISGMTFSLFWENVAQRMPIWSAPGSRQHHFWVTPGDIWVTMRAAHQIAWGGEGLIYQHSAGYITLPGIAALLAPVAMLSSALHLTEGFPYANPHPTAWLIVGPVEMLLGCVALIPVAAMLRRMRVPKLRRVAAIFLAAACMWPATVLWGHPEDLVSFAFGLYGLMAAFDKRWRRAAALLGVAIVFQPLIVLLVPLVAVYIPLRHWLRSAALMVAPSAVLLVAPLWYDWRTTTHNLVDQPTYPTLIHSTPWLALAPILRHARSVPTKWFEMTAQGFRITHFHRPFSEVVAGGPGRLLAVGMAVLIAWYVARCRPSEPMVFWLAGLALALRCVFEAVTIEYYLVPALVIAVTVASRASAFRCAIVTVLASGCTYVAYWHAGPWSYYLPVTGTLLATWALAFPLTSSERKHFPAELPERSGSIHRPGERGLAPV